MNGELWFLYGTLRQGDGAWAGEAVTGVIDDNAMTRGNLYTVGGYPLGKFDEQGWCYGDLVLMDPSHSGYESMVRVERGAGYEPREVEVFTEGGVVYVAQTWHYVRAPRGLFIRSGDWLEELKGTAFYQV